MVNQNHNQNKTKNRKRKNGEDEDNGFAQFGGYMEVKITKLEDQFTENAIKNCFKKSNLFNGISIYVNGLTDPSADELKRIMMTHGGVYHHYERSHTTYIIASNLPDVKIRAKTNKIIISPKWVVDCLKENKIVDYSKYLLYTNHKKSQPKIMFDQVDKNITNLEIKKEDKKVEETNPDLQNIIKELNILNEKLNEINQENMEVIEIPSSKSSQPTNDELNSPDMFDGQHMTDIPKCNKATDEVAEVKEDKVLSTAPNSTKNTARTAVNPNFLSEFYNNSRLHHISTLGAGFKQYVTKLREENNENFPAREKLLKELKSNDYVPEGNFIMHIDMDCFFVSVGLRDRPQLRGHPVAVTHSKGSEITGNRAGVDLKSEQVLYKKIMMDKHKFNQSDDKEKLTTFFDTVETNNSMSEIASCSYEARSKGVKNGMFVGTALKLCPNLKTIPYDFDGYKEVAFTLYNTIAQYTLDIEAVSCDEMFVDLTELIKNTRIPCMELVQYIRNEIKSITKCPCSAGVGNNRLQARLATRKAKPDGQFQLHPDNVEDFMKDINIADLPGVGYSTTHRLKQFNWVVCGDLLKVNINILQIEFGKKFGETLYQFARGIDERPLVFGQIRKSVSAEVNYGIRFNTNEELHTFLKQLCSEVHSRLKEIEKRGKCITLKYMVRAKNAPVETAKFMGHGICDVVHKSVMLQDFTDDLDVIEKKVLSLSKTLAICPKELRGIAIKITKLNLPAHKNDEKIPTIKSMFNKIEEKKMNEPKKEITDLINSDDNCETILPNKQRPPSPMNIYENNATKKHERVKAIANIKPKNKTSNVFEMLKNNSSKPKEMYSYSDDIDLEVLRELPDSMREEVLRDYRLMKQSKQKTIDTKKNLNFSTTDSIREKIKVDKEFLAVLPLDLRREVEKEIALQNDKIIVTENGSSVNQISSTKEENEDTKNVETAKIETNELNMYSTVISEDNIFSQQEWRTLIMDWINSSDSPESCDVDMLARHACEFIISKRLFDIYIKMRYLFRLIDETNNCKWHSAFRSIVEIMQTEMLLAYKSKLKISTEFGCKKCY